MQVMILRNHGVVAMGISIEEAFHIAHKLVKACEIQVRTQFLALSIGHFQPSALLMNVA